jgi:uncharacterized protein (DUF433 family)
MTKIEELIEKIKLKYEIGWWQHEFDIEEIMKEYAELYAEQFREAIINSANYDDSNDIFYISEQLILNIKLPTHE